MNVAIAAVAAAVFALLTAPSVATAQQNQRTYHIGFLGERAVSRSASAATELGHLRSRIARAQVRRGPESRHRLPRAAPGSGLRGQGYVDLVSELLKLKGDLIVAANTEAAMTAKRATTTVPIVVMVSNPERTGLVASLARPGGTSPAFPIRVTSGMGGCFSS